MRIVVLTNMYPSESREYFGVFVRDQVEDLRDLGVEVDVVSFDGRKARRNYLYAAGGLRKAVRRGGVDLVHAHYGLSGAVAITQRRVPVVTTFHGSDCSGQVPWQSRVSWVVARLSTPIFVSRHLAVRLGVAGAAVVPAAVDTELFRPLDREVARRSLGWSPDGRYALLLGSRANTLKRADLFDAAIDHARAAVPDLHAASLENLSRDEVVQVMNAADVTVMTSDTEGSPVTVRESLACCTPVVSVPVGDAATLLEDLPGCSIVGRDPSRIGDAVVSALDAGRSPKLRERAAQYSRPTIAARVVDVYRRVLGGNEG